MEQLAIVIHLLPSNKLMDRVSIVQLSLMVLEKLKLLTPVPVAVLAISYSLGVQMKLEHVFVQLFKYPINLVLYVFAILQKQF
jgi:hypothetical protein